MGKIKKAIRKTGLTLLTKYLIIKIMGKLIDLGLYTNPKSIDKLNKNFEKGDTVIVAGWSGYMYLEKKTNGTTFDFYNVKK